MRPSYLIAASLAASVALSPAFAAAADVSAKAAQAQAAPIPQVPPAASLSAGASSKAGCGAILLVLGAVADSSPELFAKQQNGKAIQTLLSALGLKGKVMLDEAFAEGTTNGLTATQTFEAGIGSLMTSIKADVAAGGNAEDMGKKAGMALMNRCTGMTQ